MIAAALWALGILLLTLYTYHKFFQGSLTDPDAMDYAQIAHNMANGHGYGTSILRPLAVSGFAGPDKTGVAPDVSRAPLYPFVLMLAMLGHGRSADANVVVAISLLLFLVSVWGVYRLARTLFPAPTQVGIALLSAGLYGVGGSALGYAVEGLPVTLATLTVTGLLIALFRAAETAKRPATFLSALWVGVWLGLCYLTQYSLLILALPVLVYLFFSRAPARAWVGIGACVLGFVIIAGPWMYRNAVLCHGDPFFTLLFYGIMANTPDYPGSSTIYRSLMPQTGPLVYFYTHLSDMLARDGRGLLVYRDTLLQGFNFFLLAAAAASLLWRASDARVNALRACAAVGIFLIVLITSLFQPSVQMIAPFAPLIAVSAVGFIVTAVSQQSWEPTLQRTALWGLGLLVGLGAFVQEIGQKPPQGDIMANGLSALSNQHLSPTQAVISDAPWEIAWRLGLPAVWLPTDNNTYQTVSSEIARSGLNITAMLLTPNMAAYDIADGEAVPWVLLSQPAHVNAYKDQENTDAKWDALGAMIAHHDPRVHALTAKYSQTILQNWVSSSKQNADANYQTNFGAISDILSDFAPQPPVTEADQLDSTLFLRTNAAPTGQ